MSHVEAYSGRRDPIMCQTLTVLSSMPWRASVSPWLLTCVDAAFYGPATSGRKVVAPKVFGRVCAVAARCFDPSEYKEATTNGQD